MRMEKLKYFVALLWTKPVLLMEENHTALDKKGVKMHIETSGRLRGIHPLFRGCRYILWDTTLEVNTKIMPHSLLPFWKNLMSWIIKLRKDISRSVRDPKIMNFQMQLNTALSPMQDVM